MLSQTYMNVWRHSKSFPTAINGHGNGHGLGGRGEAPGYAWSPFLPGYPRSSLLHAPKKQGPGQNDKKRRKPASQPGHHRTPERKNAFRIRGFPEVVGDVCLSSWGVVVCLSVCLSLSACLPVCLSGQPSHGTSYMYSRCTCLEVYNHMEGVRVPLVRENPP